MKDAKGHGSNPRGGLVAHQTGVNNIPKSAFKGLTKLGRKTLRHFYEGQTGHAQVVPDWKLGQDFST